MSATKTLKTYIAAATSNAAGSTTTGTALDHTTAYGGVITAKLTNGGTGPTVAASVSVYVSGDNTNFKLLAEVTGDTTASSVNEWAFDLPQGAMYSRVDVSGNTGQAVTCEAFCQELTTI